ncbi:MAG TPA: FCD domain-containing protein [Stellaceae bacterium]|nr:FCD domain-containing protein [Stellaceae bacterium]
MTRQQIDSLISLEPLPPVQSRARELIERLTEEIAGRRLLPGARLPTEQQMMAAFGVSRTVVREAVAALRAEGLVETRQGLGAFVSRDVQRRPFRIDPGEVRELADLLNVMELRTAVETEAAGIAAERATAKARAGVARSLAGFDAALKRGEAAVDEDFAFHKSIAEATGNPQFPRFLEFLGRFIIPRQTVRFAARRAENFDAYLAQIQAEHRRIYEAIRAADGAAAREAMRGHLMGSLRRYQNFAKTGAPS